MAVSLRFVFNRAPENYRIDTMTGEIGARRKGDGICWISDGSGGFACTCRASGFQNYSWPSYGYFLPKVRAIKLLHSLYAKVFASEPGKSRVETRGEGYGLTLALPRQSNRKSCRKLPSTTVYFQPVDAQNKYLIICSSFLTLTTCSRSACSTINSKRCPL